jgi:hypothetical protein
MYDGEDNPIAALERKSAAGRASILNSGTSVSLDRRQDECLPRAARPSWWWLYLGTKVSTTSAEPGSAARGHEPPHAQQQNREI